MRFGKARIDEKILHDEYFGEQPAAAYLLAVRLVLLCIMSASLTAIYCDLYGTPGTALLPACIAAAASGIVYTLVSLLPAAIIYGAVITAAGGIIWVLRKQAFELAAYYWDYMMVKLDSRLIKTSDLLLHNAFRIKSGSYPESAIMEQAFFWSAIALAVLCAVFFTAAVRTRFHLSVPVIAVTLVTAPSVAAETAGFFPSFLLYVVAVFGFEAIYSSYELDSGFIYGSLTASRLAEMHGDREYRKRTRFLTFGKKAESDTVRFHRYSDNMIAMALVTALVFFGASALIPEGKGLNYQQVFDTLSTFGQSTADTFGDIFGITVGTADDRDYFSSDTYGDISDSISLRPPSASDRPVLEVTLSRNDIPVYLRGDIGVEYTGNSWSSITTAAQKYLDTVGEDFYPEAEYQVFRRFLAWNGSAAPDDVMPLQMVTVRYLRNTRVVFQPLAPYELNYKKSSLYNYSGDFILRTKNGFVKTFDSLALTPFITDPGFTGKADEILNSVLLNTGSEETALRNGYISVPEMTNERYLSQTNAYRGFIEACYKKPNEPARPVITPLITNITPYCGKYGVTPSDHPQYESNAERYYIARAVCDYFRENFTYSLAANNGADILSGFLNDTHEGHCALFATAMTLALRQMNIPARYVTGYVIYPGGEPGDDGSFHHTLTERQLHAWTEVYFRGIGWLPFDPTSEVPGYADTVSAPADPNEDPTVSQPVQTAPPETEPPTAEITETSAPETDPTLPDETDPLTEQQDPGAQGGTGNSDLFITLLPFIAVLAVIAAFAAVILLFAHNLRIAEERTIKSFKALPPAEACAVMYRFVLTLLEKKGLTPGCEQFYDFAERVDGSIEMKGLNSFMMDVMPVFEKCEFGKPETAPVSEDEREAVYHYAAAVYNKVMDDVSPTKRFFMKISLFL